MEKSINSDRNPQLDLFRYTNDKNCTGRLYSVSNNQVQNGSILLNHVSFTRMVEEQLQSLYNHERMNHDGGRL